MKNEKKDRIEIIINHTKGEGCSVVMNEYNNAKRKREILKIENITLEKAQHLVGEIYHLIEGTW